MIIKSAIEPYIWAFKLAGLLIIFFLGMAVRGYMADKQMNELLLEHAEERAELVSAHILALEDLNKQNLELQRTIDNLGTQHTETLNAHLAENARLRSDLGVARRMRLQGTNCPAASGPRADDPAAGSLGDGAGVELSGETRLAVWDLREDLIRDRAKVIYLQNYINEILRTNPDLVRPPPER